MESEPRPSSSNADRDIIRVGFTEAHGMAHELRQFPPRGVAYSFLAARPRSFSVIRSPIKGYLNTFDSADHDLIEAVLSPVLTSNKWIYSVECLQAAAAFGLFGCPLPLTLRMAYLKTLFLKDNLKRIVFWSQAGRDTLMTYGRVRDQRLWRKVTVVYPAIRRVADDLVQSHDQDVHILFSGDFFRKGGVHTVDAFERAQRIYPSLKLRLCCDEQTDFNTTNLRLREEFLGKIRRNKSIVFGRVSRDEMINQVLPRTDIYALPTYCEMFGFALLEAMAFGIPVISTTYFAIPEIVTHGECGYLINTSQFDCDRLFRGYVVNEIPSDFREYMTEKVYEHLCALIESVALRRRMGEAGVRIARTKFSLETRNAKMLEIYRDALA